MFPIRFCWRCGEKIKRNRLGAFTFTALCSACKKPARLTRLVFVAIFISLLLGGFLVGRATAPRPAFHFIGEPLDLQMARNSQPNPSSEAAANRRASNAVAQSAVSEAGALVTCGAPTKAGHPCRRKVRRGSGYCYQHKDKFKAPAEATQ